MSEFIDKINLKYGRLALTSIFQKQESLGKAYEYVRLRLIQIRDQQLKLDPDVQVENNINLLNFALDNFGTYSEYIEKKKRYDKFSAIETFKPAGTIAFHQTKTNFLNLDLKVDVVESLDANDNKKSIKGFERAGNELSVKDLASSEILYLLSSLYNKSYKDPNGSTNALGVKKLANFKKVWNHTVDLLAGQRDSQKVYQMLIDESDNYPIYNQLVERLGNPLDELHNDAGFSIWAKFMETFNRTRIPLVQLTMDLIKDDENFVTGYNLTVGEASSDWRKIKYNFINGFNVRAVDEFIKSDDEGVNYLDVINVLKKYKDSAGTNPFNFFVDIGIDLDQKNPGLIEAVNKSKQMKAFAKFALDKIALLHNNNIKINNIIHELEKNYVKTLEHKNGREHAGNIKELSLLNLKYSDEHSSGMVSNARDKSQYEYSLQNSLSIMTNAINQSESFDDLMSTGFMSYLGYNGDQKNPFTYVYKNKNGELVSTSQLLNSIYDFENGGVKRENATISLNNLSGISLTDDNMTILEYSNETSNTDRHSKLINDLHMLLLSNTAGASSELLRHASKSTSYSAHPTIINTPGDDTHLYVDTKHFIKSLYGDKGEMNAVNIIIPW